MVTATIKQMPTGKALLQLGEIKTMHEDLLMATQAAYDQGADLIVARAWTSDDPFYYMVEGSSYRALGRAWEVL